MFGLLIAKERAASGKFSPPFYRPVSTGLVKEVRLGEYKYDPRITDDMYAFEDVEDANKFIEQYFSVLHKQNECFIVVEFATIIRGKAKVTQEVHIQPFTKEDVREQIQTG